MITFEWIFVLFAVVLYVLIQMITVIITKKKKPPVLYFMRISLIAYFMVVLGLTLLPFIYDPVAIQHRLDEVGDQSSAFSFIPFQSTVATFERSQTLGLDVFVRLVGANLIMLLPLGIYLPTLWRYFRNWRRSLLAGMITSCSIELMQFLIGASTGYFYRTVDIDDILFNSLGALTGYGIYKLIRPYLEQALKEEGIEEENKTTSPAH